MNNPPVMFFDEPTRWDPQGGRLGPPGGLQQGALLRGPERRGCLQLEGVFGVSFFPSHLSPSLFALSFSPLPPPPWPQWLGQRLLLPGGVPDALPGAGRPHHHLHHPPAQRQALRDVRQGLGRGTGPLGQGGKVWEGWGGWQRCPMGGEKQERGPRCAPCLPDLLPFFFFPSCTS